MSIFTGLAATSIVRSFVLALRIKAKSSLAPSLVTNLLFCWRQDGVQHASTDDHVGGINGSIAPLYVLDSGLGFSEGSFFLMNSFEYPSADCQDRLQQVLRRVGVDWIVLPAQEAASLEAALVDVLLDDLARINITVAEYDAVELSRREPEVPACLIAANLLDDRPVNEAQQWPCRTSRA